LANASLFCPLYFIPCLGLVEMAIQHTLLIYATQI